jgi:hypothetical protein
MSVKILAPGESLPPGISVYKFTLPYGAVFFVIIITSTYLFILLGVERHYHQRTAMTPSQEFITTNANKTLND